VLAMLRLEQGDRKNLLAERDTLLAEGRRIGMFAQPNRRIDSGDVLKP
jgi:hypothetical protein